MGVVAIRPELAIQRNVGVVVVLVICERGGRKVGILLGLQLAREAAFLTVSLLSFLACSFPAAAATDHQSLSLYEILGT